ncbi:AbrB/MazE/SpoVT family DNA-binding domain-containing protein [Roseateles sp.]|uniref:AbrB/MazE/SpoVT family DNA-binding domain-containing protein n=1 Tax=Roseateles sp. TaxID=1971397 RepID=UPI003BA63902
MPVKLCRWGNSHGIRLPAHVLERTGLCAGDYLFIRVTDSGEIHIRPVKARDVPAGFSVIGMQATPGSARLTDDVAEEQW